VTPVPPDVGGDLVPGLFFITGHASPNCIAIQVCQVGGGGVTPSSPPCTPPDTLLGSGPSNASGAFGILITPPLQGGECIYVFDTCSGLTSAVRCVVTPAPAPALSDRALLLACAILSAVALLGLMRLRRSGQP
jgi:hypothetical protein